MSHVEISKTGDYWVVKVDGVDLAGAIIQGGLSIEVPPWPDLPLVHVTFRADRLNATLPDAVVKAVQELDPQAVEA